MKYLALFIFLFINIHTYGQELSGSELLDKVIAYHDPNNKWETLAAKITFAPENRSGKTINSSIEFKDRGDYFKMNSDNGENIISQTVNGDTCTFELNGSTEITEAQKKEHKLNSDRAKRIRNYYVYLYGLPMKLRDPGTLVADAVIQETFMGMNYLKLKVSYEAEVGRDIWFFYINPNTYAMDAYQFYHDDINGKGEYITLEGIVEIDGIKIPKLRKWYTNKEDKFLGKDEILKVEKL